MVIPPGLYCKESSPRCKAEARYLLRRIGLDKGGHWEVNA